MVLKLVFASRTIGDEGPPKIVNVWLSRVL